MGLRQGPNSWAGSRVPEAARAGGAGRGSEHLWPEVSFAWRASRGGGEAEFSQLQLTSLGNHSCPPLPRAEGAASQPAGQNAPPGGPSARLL